MRIDEKVIVIRTKILPKFVYLGTIEPMPLEIRSKLKKLIMKTLFDNYARVEYETIVKDKIAGGLDLLDIPTKLDLQFIKPAIKFLKTSESDNNDWTKRVEQQIAITFSKFLNYRLNNARPHAFDPLQHWKSMLQVIENYQITKEEIQKESLRAIYKKVMQVNYFTSNDLSKGVKSTAMFKSFSRSGRQKNCYRTLNNFC